MPKRSPGRRPKSAHDTRTEILAAARSVFARRGLDGAAVREVAQKAKVNNAMIYYHFEDKVELYRAVLSESFAVFDRIWDHDIFTADADARLKIGKYVEELIKFQHANDDIRRILSMEFASSGQNIKWLGENLFDKSYRKLLGILNEGVKRGELKQVEADLAIAALIGIVIQTFIMKPVAEYMTGRKMNLAVDHFGSFVTGIFFEGLGTPAEARLHAAAQRGSAHEK